MVVFRQAPHDRARRGHEARAEGEGDRDGGEQALRDLLDIFQASAQLKRTRHAPMAMGDGGARGHQLPATPDRVTLAAREAEGR